jgi:hypothetical protein
MKYAIFVKDEFVAEFTADHNITVGEKVTVTDYSSGDAEFIVEAREHRTERGGAVSEVRLHCKSPHGYDLKALAT